MVLYLYSWRVSYKELERFSQVCERRQEKIDKEKEKGIKDILIVDELFEEKDSKFVVLYLNDWLIIERDGFAERLGKYNGVNTIKIYNSSGDVHIR